MMMTVVTVLGECLGAPSPGLPIGFSWGIVTIVTFVTSPGWERAGAFHLYFPGQRWVSRRPATSLFHSQRRLLIGPLPAPPGGAAYHGHIFCGKLRPVHLHPGEHFPPRSPSFVYDLVLLTHNDPEEVIPARTSPLDAFPREIPQSGWSVFLFHCGRVPQGSVISQMFSEVIAE
jgi:hypothetical protein